MYAFYWFGFYGKALKLVSVWYKPKDEVELWKTVFQAVAWLHHSWAHSNWEESPKTCTWLSLSWEKRVCRVPPPPGDPQLVVAKTEIFFSVVYSPGKCPYHWKHALNPCLWEQHLKQLTGAGGQGHERSKITSWTEDGDKWGGGWE